MSKRPVDQAPAPPKLLILAIQHLLAMYAGAVTVPLVLASALHLGADDTAYLVSSDLVACGLVVLYATIEFPFGNIALVLTWWFCFFAALRYAQLERSLAELLQDRRAFAFGIEQESTQPERIKRGDNVVLKFGG